MKKTFPSLAKLVAAPLLMFCFVALSAVDAKAQSFLNADDAIKILLAVQKEHRAVASDAIAMRDIDAALEASPTEMTKELFIIFTIRHIEDTKQVSASLNAAEAELLERGVTSSIVSSVKQEITQFLQT